MDQLDANEVISVLVVGFSDKETTSFCPRANDFSKELCAQISFTAYEMLADIRGYHAIVIAFNPAKVFEYSNAPHLIRTISSKGLPVFVVLRGIQNEKIAWLQTSEQWIKLVKDCACSSIHMLNYGDPDTFVNLFNDIQGEYCTQRCTKGSEPEGKTTAPEGHPLGPKVPEGPVNSNINTRVEVCKNILEARHEKSRNFIIEKCDALKKELLEHHDREVGDYTNRLKKLLDAVLADSNESTKI